MLENKAAIIPAPQKCDRERAIATKRAVSWRAEQPKKKRQETGCDVACGPLGRRGRYHRSNRRLPRPRRPPAGGERWAARSGGRSIIWTRHARRVRRDAIRRAPDRDAVQRARESVADVDWRVFKIPHPNPPLSPPPGRRLGARVNERSCERAPRCLSDIYRSAETVSARRDGAPRPSRLAETERRDRARSACQGERSPLHPRRWVPQTVAGACRTAVQTAFWPCGGFHTPTPLPHSPASPV